MLVVWLGLAVLVAIAVVALGRLAYVIHRDGWSFVKHQPGRWRLRTGFQGKTVWDWLQLLVVPVALALIAVGFNLVQDNREAARKQRELGIAARARAQDAQIAADARRDAALTAYLQRMSELTLQHRLTSRPSPNVSLLAHTLTLTVLRRLDGRRKGQVLQFLGDAELIRGNYAPVSLAGTDLRDLDMSYAVVRPTVTEILGDPDRGPDARADPQPPRGVVLDLSASDLRGADFTGATLFEVNLEVADLRGARFDGASLSGINLRGACLSNTHFRGATIGKASFGGAIGHDIDFANATLGKITVDVPVRLTHLKLHDFHVPDRAFQSSDQAPPKPYSPAQRQAMKRSIRAKLETKAADLPASRQALDKQCDANHALKTQGAPTIG